MTILNVSDSEWNKSQRSKRSQIPYNAIGRRTTSLRCFQRLISKLYPLIYEVDASLKSLVKHCLSRELNLPAGKHSVFQTRNLAFYCEFALRIRQRFVGR